ncbi:TetR family transcriptional regulator [Leucobacter sp. CSA2]|uniref:TetR family transcriptional regulator n=1 Tax=Leucobacter edaphi TaxID=2796472 RepID=A0A934UXL7_9MICO|nr:TetR/AcrR family transcriptional regulator [Leucobacter edaphi]MBK0421067.1 TetR family transcriptional regulator [Leucobacter edaphi]
MPRRIDHGKRDEEIADASLRVLEREGLAGLSVRKVAEEAGIAPASLRRAFPTQQALRDRCLEIIEERTTARIMASSATGRARVEHLLAQLLPVDGERRLELIAQLQLSMLALTDERTRGAAERLSQGVQRACVAAITLLADAGELSADRDPSLEAERLRALLDGLAMRGVWANSAIDGEGLTRVLGAHLDELALPAARTAQAAPRAEDPSGQ